MKVVVILVFYEYYNCLCDVSIYKVEKCRMIEVMRGGCEEFRVYKELVYVYVFLWIVFYINGVVF